MLVKKGDLRIEERVNMMGGKGHVFVQWLVEIPDFKGAGRVFQRIVLPPKSSVGYHVHHNDSEFYYVIEGTGVYDDNGEVKTVKAGDTMFTPDGYGHGIANESDETLVLLACILFNFSKPEDLASHRFVMHPEDRRKVDMHAPFNGKGDFYAEVIGEPEELTGAGRLFNLLHLLPGCELGYHPHNGETEVFFILSGKGVFNDDGVKTEVGPGDAMLTGTGHMHGMENLSGEDLVYAALIYFDKD